MKKCKNALKQVDKLVKNYVITYFNQLEYYGNHSLYLGKSDFYSDGEITDKKSSNLNLLEYGIRALMHGINYHPACKSAGVEVSNIYVCFEPNWQGHEKVIYTNITLEVDPSKMNISQLANCTKFEIGYTKVYRKDGTDV